MDRLKEILQSREVVIPEDVKTFQDIIKHFRGKNLTGLEGDDRPLLEKSEDFYITSPKEGFLQGDIIEPIVPVYIDSEGAMERELGEKAMIVSNECDCELRTTNSHPFIRLSPVYSQDTIINESSFPDDNKRKTFIGGLKANRFTEYFWMPRIAKGESDLITDLSHCYSIELKVLHQKVKDEEIKKITSLSKDAYYLLLIRLAWLTLRPVVESRRI